VKLKPGASLFSQNVTAIQQLVGSAVEGLNPEDVSVVDTHGNLLSRRKLSSEDDPSDALFERRQRIEHDLIDKINATLDPLLGHDKFRAGVTVDCDLTSSEESEDTYDPAKSVMTQSQKTEEVVTSGGGAGIPGTATNLPRPAARVGGPTNTTQRRTENISYESSHLVRKTRIPEGAIKRLSISVLVSQKMQWQGKGKDRKLVPVPESQERLTAVHDLVAAVAGFQQQRGDQITVEALPFEATLEQEIPDAVPGPVGPSKPKTWKDYLKEPMFMAAGAGALLVLLVGAGAVLFLLKRRKKSTASAEQTTKADLAKTIEEAKAKAALEAANAAEQMEAALAERIAEQQKADMAALAALKMPTVTTQKGELLAKELRENTKKDPGVSAHVLQTWLRE